jgi:enamine deaminase RidA (YjgF/YER057c/UK114 family)
VTERYRSGSPYEPQYGFSRAVRRGDKVLVSGTAPIPPGGEPVAEGAAAQMRRCVAIVAEALAALGAGLGDVVRTRMYVTDPAIADEVGRVHAEAFADAAPAATMVVVASLLDPAWLVEIEVEAVVPEGTG